MPFISSHKSCFSLFFAAFMLFSVPLTTFAEVKPLPRTLSLNAAASVKTKPDLAYVTSGVETNARTAKKAVAQNSRAMNKIIRALKKNRINETDIQTINFSVQPQYESYKVSSTKRKAPRIIGYRVNNSLYITIRDLAKLGDILDELVSLGSNKIGNISFDVSNQDKHLDEARAKAMAKAISRAKIYTQAAGVQLGKVLSINESYSYRPATRAVATRGFAAAQSAPIAAGSKKLEVRISVRWELVD